MAAVVVSMTRRPPSGMASRALTARFIRTCSICVGSARTRPSGSSGRKVRTTSSPMRRPSILITDSMVWLRSSTRVSKTWRRLKARSWRVSPAARWLAAQLLRVVAEEPLRLSARRPDDALPVDDHGRVGGRLEKVVEEALAPGQALERLLALAFGTLQRPALLGLPKLALDGGAESGEPVLEEDVVGARLQPLHRLLLPDGPGDDHERGVETSLLPHLHRI